jgi:hypothetical protein
MIQDTASEVCFPYITQVVLGQYQIIIALAMLGRPKPTGRANEHGSEYEVSINRVCIHQRHLNRHNESLQIDGPQMLQSIIAHYEQQQTSYVIFKSIEETREGHSDGHPQAV